LIEHIQLYPNPTNGLTYVGFETKEKMDVELSVHNLTGQELQHFNYRNIHGAFSAELNLSNFASGTYLIKIKTVNGLFIRKIAVQ
jgi:desulfoferrodoxin (superoxide reductase-like protein)